MQKRRPALEVAVAFGVKLVLLSVLYWLFFSPAKRPVIDDVSVARHLVGEPAGSTQ